ncbi:MAG: branched-chain amino acid ABC transporter substrate-binding protein [Spirochaetia bacterium]|nr:branched-chain amino acid ABC transporter substrate-binding protein [Spirochaetia bacterium]
MKKRKFFVVCAILTVLLIFGSVSLYAGGAQEEEDAVKIAFIGPLTGPNAAQGVGARNSFLMAIDEVNNSGKLPYTIEVIVLDDESKPGTAASVAQMAVSDPDIVAASGHWNSPCAEATIPIFKSEGIPFIVWGAISPTLTSKENYPYVTRVCPTQAQENIPLAKFAMEELDRQRWAIISDTSTYGKSNTEAWENNAKEYSGVEIVSLDEIQVGTTDFRPILSKIKNRDLDGVYFGGVVMEGALVRRQMVELDMEDTLMVGISGIVDDKFIETAGADAAEGVVAVKPGKDISRMSGGTEFVENYKSAGYSEPFGAYGPYAYDAAKIITTAMAKVGPDKNKLIDAIANIEYSGLLGTTSFNEFGQTENVVSTIYVVQDGKFVPWYESDYEDGSLSLPGAD